MQCTDKPGCSLSYLSLSYGVKKTAESFWKHKSEKVTCDRCGHVNSDMRNEHWKQEADNPFIFLKILLH